MKLYPLQAALKWKEMRLPLTHSWLPKSVLPAVNQPLLCSWPRNCWPLQALPWVTLKSTDLAKLSEYSTWETTDREVEGQSFSPLPSCFPWTINRRAKPVRLAWMCQDCSRVSATESNALTQFECSVMLWGFVCWFSLWCFLCQWWSTLSQNCLNTLMFNDRPEAKNTNS